MWYFSLDSKRLNFGDGRIIKLGRTHKVKGEIIPCNNGLHASPKIMDALSYASGHVVWRVELGGIIKSHGNPIDKYAASERTYVSGGINIEGLLREFARKCALDVLHLWDAPDVVKKYLETGDESLRAAAWAAAWDAARDAAWDAAGAAAGDAAGAAAGDAAGAAAGAAAWDAARDAAWDAARDAAGAAAWDAAGDAAGDAAWDAVGAAARAKQNRRLTRMINRAIKDSK
jgi:hypothetical protein